MTEHSPRPIPARPPPRADRSVANVPLSGTRPASWHPAPDAHPERGLEPYLTDSHARSGGSVTFAAVVAGLAVMAIAVIVLAHMVSSG